jgi:FMN reductase
MSSEPQVRSGAVRVVGIGGSVDPGSQSERAMRAVLQELEAHGATTQSFTGTEIDFPPYHTGATLPEHAGAYLEAVRAADAVVLSSPGYHGTVSGLVKNALDYLEELRTDARPYLDGRAVGLIAVAHGWQAAVTTLVTLRQVTHALRGWPTPIGITVNGAETRFADDGAVTSTTTVAAGSSSQSVSGRSGVAGSIEVMAQQLLGFARR